MPNTYANRIVSLKKENGIYLNMIKSFIIEVTVSNGSSQISAEYKIDLPDPEMDFTEYQNLQESDLINWYENDFIQKDFVTRDIDKKLQESIQDTVESNFPWL
jgi:uncharacterized protein YuzB (UPF0349 family)